MECTARITPDLLWVGGNDRRLNLFENIFPIPRGVSYNSYLLLDEKTVLVDTVDKAISGVFFDNLTAALDGRQLNYIVVNHMEPDHAATLAEVCERYPGAQVMLTAKGAQMAAQFFGDGLRDRLHAVSDGAELAREIADITIGADNLYELVTLKKLSNRLMKRINSNYRSIVGINSGLIGAGVFGLIPPTTSAMFHNISTLGITLNSMKNLLPEQELPQVEEHCQEA